MSIDLQKKILEKKENVYDYTSFVNALYNTTE